MRGALDVRLSKMGETGEKILGIAREFGLSDDSVRAHYEKHLPDPLRLIIGRHADLAAEVSDFDALASLKRMTDRAESMLEAADAWLRDPKDPSKYNLNPRTHEVDIVFEEEVGDRTIRKTEKLSKLMADVEGGLGITVVKGETKIADPRKLLLEAVEKLKPVVELLGKAKGQIKADPVVSLQVFLGSPEWTSTQALLVEAVKDHPEAAERVALALEAVGKGGGR